MSGTPVGGKVMAVPQIVGLHSPRKPGMMIDAVGLLFSFSELLATSYEILLKYHLSTISLRLGW